MIPQRLGASPGSVFSTTTMAGSIASFYSGAKVCHIEAGLRTNNKFSPFPEEINRQITSRISDYHFAPTLKSKNNLIKENINKNNIIVTGNTSAMRGKANFAYFAPTKSAQRILAQSIARELGPKGVHVAYIIVDAAIDTPRTRPIFFGDKKDDDFFCKPSAIAEEIYHVAHQNRSAWSFDVEIRPDIEKW